MTSTSKNDFQQIQDVMKKTKDKRMFERYQIISLFLQGHTQIEIIKISGRSSKTIFNYIKSYRNNGIDGLTMCYSTGAPRKLTPEQEQELVQVIVNKLPSNVGFPNKNRWTLSIIKSFIEKEWKQTYTLRGISRLLHDLGLSYTKPTYTLAKADSKKQKEFVEEIFPAYKKTLK